jgi:hypothetical protein
MQISHDHLPSNSYPHAVLQNLSMQRNLIPHPGSSADFVWIKKLKKLTKVLKGCTAVDRHVKEGAALSSSVS